MLSSSYRMPRVCYKVSHFRKFGRCLYDKIRDCKNLKVRATIRPLPILLVYS
jgi:hypothetical protein